MARGFRFTKALAKKWVVALISLSFALKDEEFHALGHQFSTHSITLSVWKLLKLSEVIPRITSQLRKSLEKIEKMMIGKQVEGRKSKGR